MNEKRRPQGRNFPPRSPQAAPAEETEGQLEGRNALQEALRSGRTIDKVFIADGDTDRGLQRLAAEAKDAGAVVVSVDRRKLDAMSFTHAHQGVIALAAAHAYFTVDDILEEAASRGEAPLIVICDELSDPHNLGAILRSAECAGAHGVIIPKRRSVGLTATVAKASAGAVEYMKVARVTNINTAIAELKDFIASLREDEAPAETEAAPTDDDFEIVVADDEPKADKAPAVEAPKTEEAPAEEAPAEDAPKTEE